MKEPKDIIKALYKEPYEEPREITIPNTLEQFQKLVDGYIMAVTAVQFCGTDRHLIVICDDEAKIKEPRPEPNLFLDTPPLYNVIYGPVVVVAADGEWFDGLSEDELSIAETWLRMTEIVKEGE